MSSTEQDSEFGVPECPSKSTRAQGPPPVASGECRKAGGGQRRRRGRTEPGHGGTLSAPHQTPARPSQHSPLQGWSLNQGTQLCLPPCLSFPPRTQGRGRCPLLRTSFPGVHLEQEEFWRESKCPSTKPASQSHQGRNQHLAPSSGNAHPSCPGCPHAGRIPPEAKGAEGRHGCGAGTPGEPPVARGGGGLHATRIHPRWNQLNPRLPPPEGPWAGASPSAFPAKPTQNEPPACTGGPHAGKGVHGAG